MVALIDAEDPEALDNGLRSVYRTLFVMGVRAYAPAVDVDEENGAPQVGQNCASGMATVAHLAHTRGLRATAIPQ